VRPCLPVSAGGVDPDDAFSSVPYEKGFAFIHYLQASGVWFVCWRPAFFAGVNNACAHPCPALPSLHTSLLPRPQELVGGSAVFEPFFKSYIQRFSGTPLTSDDFRAFFCEHFKDVEAIKQVDWDTWFYKPGGRRDAHVGLAAKR
jgi:leukotriene-A4 hydrolase